MTKVTIRKDEGKYIVLASEHATGSAETCAGISAILYELAGWLENNRHLCKSCDMRLEPAYVIITFEPTRRGRAEVRTAFEMTLIGLLQIEKGYADYIQVILE